MMAVVISKGKATLRELEEYYSLEDLYTLYEIITVDNNNEQILMKRAQEKSKHGR